MWCSLSRLSKIKQLSDKKRAQGPDRRKCIAAVFVRDKGQCRAKLDGCERVGSHVHEKRSRAQGGSVTDPDNCLLVCKSCHRLIHNNPAMAYEQGLLIRGDSNR